MLQMLIKLLELFSNIVCTTITHNKKYIAIKNEKNDKIFFLSLNQKNIIIGSQITKQIVFQFINDLFIIFQMVHCC